MPARIVVADDNPALVEMLADVLQDEGYAVRAARDGMEALAALDREGTDLLISDIRMPRLSGIELAQRVRGREGAQSRLPIILITAAPLPAALPPQTHLIHKPFDLLALLDLVAELLAESAAG